MSRGFLCVAACLMLAPQPAVCDRSDAAVQKVIEMLTDMLVKAKSTMHDEEVSYGKFSTWCAAETSSLKKSITAGGESIEVLNADIGELTSEAKTLIEEITALTADVEKYEADTKAAIAQRAADHKSFLAEQADYGESMDALERAIVVLQKQSYDRPASSAVLLQLSESAALPEKAKSVIAAFAEMMSDDSQSPPEANAYEFQSGGIVEMLKKLLADFTAKKEQVEKEEMNSKHAADMVLLDLKNSIEVANKAISEKTMLKDKKLSAAALAKKELGEVEATKKEDESTLSKLTTDCTEKSLSYKEKQQLRKEEIAALAEAIKILNTEEARGGDYLLSLSQKKSGHALVQLMGGASMDSTGIHKRIREFLFAQAQKLHSKNLNLLAEKVAADPFAKVTKMIDDMITKLEEEAFADATHEGFCDEEFGKSKITRAKLTEEIAVLTASIDEGKAEIASLTQEIATLTQEVADLDAATATATKLRKEEKAKNTLAVEDATAAKTATESALQVLKEFYEKASKATGFLQVSSKKAPVQLGSDEWESLANPNFEGTVDWGHKEGMATFGEKYTGQQATAGGVLAMMEVIISDFATVVAETEASEAAALKEYEGFMTESKKNKAMKLKSIEMLTADKISTEGTVQSETADLKSTQDQLIAADKYHARLVPQCVDQGMTFEGRTAARAEEIASLKEALKLLNGVE